MTENERMELFRSATAALGRIGYTAVNAMTVVRHGGILSTLKPDERDACEADIATVNNALARGLVDKDDVVE